MSPCTHQSSFFLVGDASTFFVGILNFIGPANLHRSRNCQGICFTFVPENNDMKQNVKARRPKHMSLSDLKVGAKLQQTLERGNIFLHIIGTSENWSKSILNAIFLSSNQLNQLNLYFWDLSGVANGVVISNCFGSATQLPEIQPTDLRPLSGRHHRLSGGEVQLDTSTTLWLCQHSY